MRVGDAIAAERITVARQLCVDAGAAPAGGAPLLQHEEARPLAEYEAVARAVERAAGALRRVVVCGQRAEQAKSREASRVDHRIEATGEDVVARAATDQLEGRADCLAARRARGVHRAGVATDAKAPQEQRT